MSKPDSSRPRVKIGYIGGGSRYWARDLMKDLALTAPFDGEIALYDIDPEAAARNVQVGQRLFSRPEAKSRFTVRAVKSLGACLKGADFVVCSIEPGPTEARFADLEIPLRHGIVQPVGDSTGPGGILRALRAIPTYVEFARAIMTHCPKAWVINYTNPMTLCTRALHAAAPEIRAFGCCHEVFGSQGRLLRLAQQVHGLQDLRRQEVRVDVNGVNHFTWITAASCRGIDLMPALRDHAADPARYADASAAARKRVKKGKFFGSEGMVAIDLMRRFGALGAAGDRHLVEFVPHYARDERTLHRWGVVCTPYAHRLKRSQSKDVPPDSYAQGEINPTGEEGVVQMSALLGLADLDTNVNLPNRGQSPDLPRDAVVETNAAFRRGQVTPLLARPMPAGACALVRRVVEVQELTLRAALGRDLDLARQAILCDPLVTLSPDRAEKMCDEMFGHIRPLLEDAGY
jgi:alpha-galactosidase